PGRLRDSAAIGTARATASSCGKSMRRYSANSSLDRVETPLEKPPPREAMEVVRTYVRSEFGKLLSAWLQNVTNAYAVRKQANPSESVRTHAAEVRGVPRMLRIATFR